MQDDTEVVRFEILIAVVMKSFIFWNIMLCILVKVNRHLRANITSILKQAANSKPHAEGHRNM